MRRDLGERHLDPLLLEDREGELIVAVVDRRRLVHFADAGERIAVGQPLPQADQQPGASHDDTGRQPEALRRRISGG